MDHIGDSSDTDPCVVSDGFHTHVGGPHQSDRDFDASLAYSLPPPIVKPLSLLFYDDHLNALYYQHMIQSSLAGTDRYSIIIQASFIITLASRMPYFPTSFFPGISALFLYLVTWFWAARMHTALTTHIYTHYRTYIVLTWRIIAIPSIYTILSQHSPLLPGDNSQRGPLVIFSLLMLKTRVAPLMFHCLGMLLPFWLHITILPPQLIMLWYLGVDEAASDICDCCVLGTQQLHNAFTWLSLPARPVSHVVLNAAEVELGVGQCLVCPGRQLALFVVLCMGGVVPALVVYQMERASRMRFAAEHMHGVPSAMWLWHYREGPDWMDRLLLVVQAWLTIGLLWQILDFECNN